MKCIHSPIRLDFRRSEVEAALWQVFARGPNRPAPAAVPMAFRTRIKRLLEIDRALDLSGCAARPEAPFAFLPEAPEGTGHDVHFGNVDAFVLAVALDLLDAGAKQSEVVFLLRYLRSELARRFYKMLVEGDDEDAAESIVRIDPAAGALRIAPGARIDNRVFLVIRKMDLNELVPAGARTEGEAKGPRFGPPVFCNGIEALRADLAAAMPRRLRTALVVELAGVANAVVAALRALPEGRRLRR